MINAFLELAFHLVAVSGLARVAHLLGEGKNWLAIVHTLLVCGCILAIAAALHFAMALLF